MTAKELKEWRHRLNISDKQAAAALNTPLATYRNWENGHRNILGPVERLTNYITDHGLPTIEEGRIVAYDTVRP